MIFRFTISLLLFFFQTSYSAIPTLESILNDSTTKGFPNYISKGLIMNPHTSDSFSYEMTFNQRSTGLFLKVATKATESWLHMDTNFNVKSATFNVQDEALIKKINYTQRIANRNGVNEVVFQFFSKDQKIREKGVYYTKNTLDTFSIIPVLQHLCAYEETAFTADFSVQHMATKVPVTIQKIITKNLIPFVDGYTLPSQLEHHLKTTQKSYIIYVLNVKGWQGLIYNHRHYYVYSNSAPYTYVGHWGGSDKTNLFSWAINP